MRRFTGRDFSELALIAILIQSDRNPNATTDELIRQGAEMAEQIIREENMQLVKLEIELPQCLIDLMDQLEKADPELAPNRIATLSISYYLMASQLPIPEKKEAAEVFLNATFGEG